MGWEEKELWTHITVDAGLAPRLACNETHCNGVNLAPQSPAARPCPCNDATAGEEGGRTSPLL